MSSQNNPNTPIVNKNPQNPTQSSVLPSSFTGSFPGSSTGGGQFRPPGGGQLPGTQYPQLNANSPNGNDPRGNSTNMVDQTVGRFRSQFDPILANATYNNANANATDTATRNQINQGYGKLNVPLTGGGGGGNTASLNTRLPGESSYDWAKRAAITTGRTDIANDPGALQYWADSINSKPQSSDMGYWTDKFGGGGGGGIGGSYGNYTAFGVNPGSYTAAQAALMQAGPAAQAGTQYASAERAAPSRELANDPNSAFAGYKTFSQTGGYSPEDIANLRARGVAPIRAAYDAASRNVNQQRSLQGGYAPNAIAAQVKMAREQGQSMADAGQNVEAGIVADRNRGMLSGLEGINNIGQFDINSENDINKFNVNEGNQVGMFNAGQGNQVGMFNTGQQNDISKFNVNEGNQVGMFNTGQTNAANQFNLDLGFRGDVFNAGANQQAQANAINDQFRSLEGQRALYGTTPGMSAMFGQQVGNLLGTGASFDANSMSAYNDAQRLPGQFDQTLGRIDATGRLINQGAQAANQIFRDPNTGQVVGQPGGYPGVQGGYPPSVSDIYPPTTFDPRQYPGGQGMPSLPAPTPFNPNQFPTQSPQQGVPNQQYVDPFRYANATQMTPQGQGFGYPPYQQNNLSRYGYGGNAIG